MRKLLLLLSASALLAIGAAHATPANDTMKTCAAAWSAMSPADKAKTTYKAYSAGCLKKKPPAAPAMTAATPQQDRMKTCAASWTDAKKAGTTAGQTYKAYMAICLKKAP